MRTLVWSTSGKLNVALIARSRPIRPDSTSSARQGGLRVVPVHERLGQHQSGRVGGVEGLLDLGRAPRVGLLAEHVLARGERLHRPGVMQAVRQRDVDAVDLRVLEQRLVAPVRALETVLGGVRLSLRSVPAPNRDDVDAIGALRSGEDGVVDPRGREEAESHEEPSPRPASASALPRQRVVVGAREPAHTDRTDPPLPVERGDAALEEREERDRSWPARWADP